MKFSTDFISATKEYSSFSNFVPAPYIKKNFDIDFIPTKAEILICGLGFYEFWLNSEHMTKGRLAPYISNPNDILYYNRYDITDKIKKGKNSFAFILGNGMQNSFGGEIWDFQLARWRSAPKLALCFEATDGKTTVSFEADESFKTFPSPTYLDDLRVGEFYNANNCVENWNSIDFDDSKWNNAIKVDAPAGECREGIHEPVVHTRDIKVKRIYKSCITKEPEYRDSLPHLTIPDDEKVTSGFMYDFGENCAGVCKLKIHGKKGQKVIMQFGEKLVDDGLDLSNMAFLPEGFDHRDIYICKGDGEETWTPMFTYHGFQYCLVMGIDESQATEDLLTYEVMNTDLKDMGGFSCSDDTINKMQEIARRSDLANFVYFPTDCPHREKNGWTGDAQLSCEQFLMNFSAENSLREWLFNIRKAQSDNGALPGIVPTAGWGFEWGNGPAWDAVLTELPYRIWQYRGNTDVLEENSDSIFRYIAYIAEKRDEKGLVHIGLGDWCPVGDKVKSPLEFTDSVITMSTAQKASKIFEVCNQPLRAEFAEKLAEELRLAIRTHLLNTETLEIAGQCQTSQAAALYYGVFDDAEKQKAFEVLLKYIHQANDSIDVGIIGFRTIFHVLSEFGYDELALHMLAKPEYPSIGNMIARGANTLWENFPEEPDNGWSNNHHFFGDYSAWLIKNIAGIIPNPNIDNSDYILISPKFVKSLNFTDGWYMARKGRVSVRWEHIDCKVKLLVTVPDGIDGKIKLRNGSTFEDGENEMPLKSGEYIINN